MLKRHDIGIILLAIGFFIYILLLQWEDISTFNWELRLIYLLPTVVGIFFLFFLASFGWHLVILELGEDVRLKNSISIWVFSNFARYLPGGIWAYGSRVSLAKNCGISIKSCSISLYLETLLLMSSSLAVGLPSIGVVFESSVPIFSSLILIPSFGFMMHPRLIGMLKYFPGRLGSAFSSVRLPRFSVLLAIYLYYVFYWVAFGVLFVLFLHLFYDIPYNHWLTLGSSISLGFFLGFIVIFVPGGIGVRESAIYLVLTNVIPSPINIVVVVLTRIWVMLGEFGSLGAILVWRRIKS